ncbi:hypothetical protein AOQ84DRAFT_378609 [Glonium stellatum]|uniref:Uncharacterized protein n=1 Tax=Glonium stellatum TaxID=574774 RepID=A0A8E2JR58_9PEZI|nr:hypothetical protein AOQ84DRAFT_378609 [Glonium stellatum]
MVPYNCTWGSYEVIPWNRKAVNEAGIAEITTEIRETLTIFEKTLFIMYPLKAILLSLAVASSVAARPQTGGQDVVIECFPGADGFPFSVTTIDSGVCATSAEIGEGFPKATSAQLLSTGVVTSCRAFAADNCSGLSTTFTTTQTTLAPGIAGNVGSYSCP